MRTLLSVTAILLTPAAALSAQTISSSTIVLQAPSLQNCPVGIMAQRTPQGAVQQVSRASDHPLLGYNISLRSFDAQLVAKAQVTLSGLAGARVLPAASFGTKADTSESFTITPGTSPKAAFESIVYTKKLTGVLWIEVNQVTYADGTEWHQTKGSVCRVAPNGFLPVNAIAH